LYATGDTIVAISTASGVGAIGIVRLSGPGAFDLTERLLKKPCPLERKRRILHGLLVDPKDGQPLDDGLVLWMKGPQSATGEDVAECHVHGSPAVLRRLMGVFTREGARPAEPGEFTYRAFLNGRIDLAQAEAVQALVSARGEEERRQALKQLTGNLSAFLEPVEERLKDLYLQIEARIEFPEDGIPPIEKNTFLEKIRTTRTTLDGLLASYDRGQVLREGLTVALVGAPNVGKSSLLNKLLGTNRAIVTHLPGTTRDVIEGEIVLSGLRVRLFDTAGLRETEEVVEAEGVERAKQTLREADLVLYVLDPTQEGDDKPWEAHGREEATWWVYNKKDLWTSTPPTAFPDEKTLAVSCKTGEGIEELTRRLEDWAKRPGAEGDVVLLQERHRREIQTACKALGRLEEEIEKGDALELWAEETKAATLAVGRVRGLHLQKDAFEEIFSRFCIGK